MVLGSGKSWRRLPTETRKGARSRTLESRSLQGASVGTAVETWALGSVKFSVETRGGARLRHSDVGGGARAQRLTTRGAQGLPWRPRCFLLSLPPPRPAAERLSLRPRWAKAKTRKGRTSGVPGSTELRDVWKHS